MGSGKAVLKGQAARIARREAAGKKWVDVSLLEWDPVRAIPFFFPLLRFSY